MEKSDLDFECLLEQLEDLQTEMDFLFFKVDAVKCRLKSLRESASLTEMRKEIQKLRLLRAGALTGFKQTS